MRRFRLCVFCERPNSYRERLFSMDRRVKPGGDERRAARRNPLIRGVANSSLPGVARRSMLSLSMKTYWLYILANHPRGTLYVGMTSDLIRRICEHREGVVEGFSKTYGVK